ncbi:MAG: SDR family oxidoreductase [Pseudomonadaceae bacterium]|nr:SDR family oxidoreductase [Pseudomonadaceae bacterium]
MNRLEGKTALVTGAARGLGEAIARRFTEAGARVFINDLNLSAAQETAARLGGYGLAADVSSADSVAAMFAELWKQTDSLDILVNNAGISGLEGMNDIDQRMADMLSHAEKVAAGAPIDSIPGGTDSATDSDWQRMMSVHVDGTFHCSREALKRMYPAKSGNIINMGSIMGTLGRGGGTAYCTAKAAILGFTRALAHEAAPMNVRVNAIAPGWIATDMTDPMEAMHPMLKMQTPLARLGDVDDIAWAAVYLASEEAKFVTGQTLSPNGGWYMSQ